MDRGFGIAGSLDRQIVRQIAPLVESLGFRTLWINDTPDGDSLEACELATSVTAHLRVATGVIPIDRKSADDIVAELRQRRIPADRLTIGIGSGRAARPLVQVRAAVAILRQVPDLVQTVAVGALGPRMTALAAQTADDVLLNWLTADAARMSAGEIRAISTGAGQTMPRVTAYVRVATADSGIERLGVEAARYAGYPAYAAHFRRFGVDALDTTIGSRHEGTIMRRLDAFQGAVDEIVVRAIPADETFAAYRDLAMVSAPGRTSPAR